MKLRNIISPAEVDFWLDTDRYSNFIKHESGDALVFNIDMVRLASIRTSISNFVRILTRRYIPVCFIDSDENMNIGGKLIYISAKITTKQEFDCAVGQSLHEGAHSVKTNFEMVKAAWANIPSHLLKLSDSRVFSGPPALPCSVAAIPMSRRINIASNRVWNSRHCCWHGIPSMGS